MDIISAYREVGTYRGAAAISGTTPKTVQRVIAGHESGQARPVRALRKHNYDEVVELVVERVEKTKGKITAKRLLPAAQAAGYAGSARNFRRLVAERKALWRRENHRCRRPAVWSPGEHLVIDWGVLGGLHVFCAVLAWCRVRFVRFADNERADTTLALIAECFEALGGGPGARCWLGAVSSRLPPEVPQRSSVFPKCQIASAIRVPWSKRGLSDLTQGARRIARCCCR